MYSLTRLWKRYFHSAPKSLALARERIRGRRGLEVGGPSQIFTEWYSLSPSGVTYPVYGACATLDNCDFAQSTTWAEHHRQYRFQRWKAPGRNYFAEGSAMHEIPDASYDFLLSSHNLEHFANPLKTLREWQRVVKPGGALILVLPHREKTFDIGRAATPVAHLLEDFAQDRQEDDLTHMDEIVDARRRTGTYEEGLEEVFWSTTLPAKTVKRRRGSPEWLALRFLRNRQADFHVMLNPDVLFTHEAMSELLRVFEHHPHAVRVMPLVQFPDGREQHLTKLLPTPLDFALRRFLPHSLQRFAKAKLDRYELKGLPREPSTAIPFLSGCFVLARSATLEAVGGFDDRYFLYMEDVDLCRRMVKFGDLLYWPAVSITHGYHRGSHKSVRLMLRHLQSSWHYYNRWGWLFDRDRKRANAAALQDLAARTALPSRG